MYKTPRVFLFSKSQTISTSKGTIEPYCAESAVKHQSINQSINQSISPCPLLSAFVADGRRLWMTPYDSVNRNVLNRVRKVARDGADVTSSGRQFYTWGSAFSNRKCSAANSGTVNQRLDEAVAAGREKSSATWKVGNVGERAKLRRCTAVNDRVYTMIDVATNFSLPATLI